MSALTDEEIDECSDSMRNALGGIYHNSVYEFARAVIAANNAKVLADLKPFGFLHEAEEDIYETEFRYSFGSEKIDCERCKSLYSADQVAALVQERDALQNALNSLEDKVREDALDARFEKF